ncbi:(2Fe-2S)-binding protein [Rhodoplanes sp. SY1]|uniref:(2Fe-2S)-binding protein n=1 Tax=Rhodoplanes sp. SY1 TaxID=3166646 RepID=UPI0038B466A1
MTISTTTVSSVPINVTINGEARELVVAPSRTLLDVLRNEAGLTGTKKGCDVGDCGACTVLLDDVPVNSCLVLAVEADGRSVTTIEGIAPDPDRLHPLQENFMALGASQCGFCTPGIIVMAKALLDKNPNPTEEEIRFGLAGNICRCTGYTKIVEAIQVTARQMAAAGPDGA